MTASACGTLMLVYAGMKDWMTSNTEANASRVHELTWWQEHNLNGGLVKIGARNSAYYRALSGQFSQLNGIGWDLRALWSIIMLV
jgi:hypothetical protein